MTTSKQNKEFTEALLPQFPLDQAIEWIGSNMDPGDVFDASKLEAWAEGNGFKQES